MQIHPMEVTKDELASVLGGFNPWWRGDQIPDLPDWHRAAFGELRRWVAAPKVARAIFLSGARQIGKTTLLFQTIDDLLRSGIPPGNIIYATFDHPLIKLAGVDAVLDVWREREPKCAGAEFVFLDEAQFIRDHGTWIKHQVDFFKQRRITFTGSAMPLRQTGQESGFGRWHDIPLTTLSFYEYQQLKKLDLPPLPPLPALQNLLSWTPDELRRATELARPYVAHFHNHLVHGGFPQIALLESTARAQQLLREDIVDKAIKRDMTATFGVRQPLDLEQVFLYLCRHDGGILDMTALSNNLRVTRPTAQRYIEFLEATHLICRLPPFAYGKEILHGRHKIYMADAAIAPAVMLQGRAVIDNPSALGTAVEAAVLKHLRMHYHRQGAKFCYWRGKKDKEVDLVAEFAGNAVPFEVKYRSQPANARDLRGLLSFCAEKSVERGYVVTKSLDDFGPLQQKKAGQTRLFRIPAPLLCYWMGAMEQQETA